MVQNRQVLLFSVYKEILLMPVPAQWSVFNQFIPLLSLCYGCTQKTCLHNVLILHHLIKIKMYVYFLTHGRTANYVLHHKNVLLENSMWLHSQQQGSISRMKWSAVIVRRKNYVSMTNTSPAQTKSFFLRNKCCRNKEGRIQTNNKIIYCKKV